MYPDQKVNTFKNFYKTTDTWKMHFHQDQSQKVAEQKIFRNLRQTLVTESQ